MPGSFTLRPKEANLTRDTVYIGKMSPYCAFQLGEETISTAICKRGGKNPHWADVCTMPASMNNDSLLKVHVIDNETLLKDDHIGSFSLDLKEVVSAGNVSKWYPLFYNDKPAGEILLETSFVNQDSFVLPADFKKKAAITREESLNFDEPVVGETASRIYHEQRQTIEPHTFTKEVDYVDTVSVMQKVEMMEPIKVMKDVEYTKLVAVMKKIEVVEPQVVKKMIEVVEPRVVTKTIQVVENVVVMREVEVIESRSIIKEIETFEPQTFRKQVEVTEYVPVIREVQVTEPVHLKKTVEYVEPVTTTKTITKEIREPIIISEEVRTTVGPATVLDVELKRTVVAAETRVATATAVVVEEINTAKIANAAVVVEETKTTLIPTAVVEITQTNTLVDEMDAIQKSAEKRSKKQKQAEKKFKQQMMARQELIHAGKAKEQDL